MNEFRIVKEHIVVTRFYLVKAPAKSAIEDVKKCDINTSYLESCDVLWWDDANNIKYEIEELPENWEQDARLKSEARAINEDLLREIPETDLTKRKRKRIIQDGDSKSEPPKLNVLGMLGMK